MPDHLNSTKRPDTIASRFINCTKKVFTFKNRKSNENEVQTSPYDVKKEVVKKFSHNDSKSNSISNSSLREVDEEFNSAELEEFLAEIKREKI